MNDRRGRARGGVIGVVVIAAIGALGVALWEGDSSSRGGTSLSAVTASPDHGESMVASGELGQPPPLAPITAAVHEGTEEDSGVTEGRKAAVSQASYRVVGTFVDHAGRSLRGVTVAHVGRKTNTRSDTLGAFALGLVLPATSRGETVELLATLAGYTPRTIDVTLVAATIDLGELVLGSGGALLGRVVDADGVGFEGAEVLATHVGPAAFLSRDARPREPLVVTHSGPDGSFRLGGLSAGDVRLWAGSPGMLWAYTNGVRVTAGAEVGGALLRLVPGEDEGAISMVVQDPSGEPIPGAVIRYQYRIGRGSGSGSHSADVHGAHRHLLDVLVPHDFSVADSLDRYRPAAARGVVPGTTNLVLRLGEPVRLVVWVSDANGTALPEFRVQLNTLVDGKSMRGQRARGEASDEKPGEVVLQMPVESFEITASAPGHEEATFGVFDPLFVKNTIDVTLTRLERVRGRVVDEVGRSVASAKVSLHESDEALQVNGFRSRSRRGSSASGTSEDDGTFELTLREPGLFFLRATLDGRAPGEAGPFELDPNVGARGLVVVVSPGGAIEGRVLVAGSESSAGRIVGISRADGFGVTARADGTGRFRFDHLTPGRWFVEGRQEELLPSATTSGSRGASAGSLPWSCDVLEGRTTSFDLDLRREQHVVVEGRLLLSGKALDGWRLDLVSTSQYARSMASGRTDAAGNYSLNAKEPGTFLLRISGRAGGSWINFSQVLHLDVGTRVWNLALAMGRVEGTVQSAEGEPLKYSWSGSDGLSSSGSTIVGEGGRFVFPGVPVGNVTLKRAGAAASEPRVNVMVREGETAQVDL